jgi:hypothetical protein
MAVTKTVSFAGPYIGRTFQTLAWRIAGGDGYLDGGRASDDGVNITIAPFSFIQSGIVCTQDAASTIPVPSGAGPWFVLASVIDDDPATGVLLSATADVAGIGAAVVIAYKANAVWYNPLPISLGGVLEADAPRPGRESGLIASATVAAGVVASFSVSRGVAVDARGERRQLGAAGNAAASVVPYRPGSFDRNDYLVLRRRERGSEIVLALGNAIGEVLYPPNPSESGPQVTRPWAYARPGGGLIAQAFAWGNGTALRLSSFLGLTSAGTGYFAPINAYTGAAQIANVIIVGQRTSDQAIVVVFTEGNNVKVAAFAEADGSVVNAPVRIDAQPNACIRVRATMDLDGSLHTVYQHNEGGAPPNQQVYYTKCSLASASFGAPAVTPRLVNGVNSTNNDTWPSIGVDRQRRAHVAYATGTGANDFGQLRYVVLDVNGSAVSRTTYAAYGQQPDPNSEGGIVDGTSLVDNIARPQVVVTPHDEVNVFLLVKRLASAPTDEVGLFNPQFQSRLGFPIVLLSRLFAPSGMGTDSIVSLGAITDDVGQLLVLANWSASGVLLARLDTVIAPRGVLGESYLDQPAAPLAQLGNTDPELVAVPGCSGDLIFGCLNGTAAVLGDTAARFSGRAFTPHPHDVFLAGWQVDNGSDQILKALSLPETAFQVFHTRPKKMSYPILVGDDGDYQGYGSLFDALAAANRIGGHVVVRSGSYRPTAPLVLASGVRVEGEGNVYLDCISRAATIPPGGWVQLGTMPVQLGCTVAGTTVTLAAGAPPLRRNVRPGDLCELFDATGASTGLSVIRRVLDDARFTVDGSPTGVSATLYACGVELKNVTLASPPGLNSAVPLMVARGLWRGVLERVRITGNLEAGGAGLRLTSCRETVARDVDVSAIVGVAGSASVGIWVDYGSDNLIDRALLGDADGTHLKLDVTTQNPRVLNCSGTAAAPARYQVDALRTTPAIMTSCLGRVDGDLKNIVTPVGKVLSSVMGRSAPAGAMQFQDENMMQYQGGTPLDLTAPSAAGSQFNGATPKVLVPSVNERLIRAGDAMTGELGVTSMLFPEIADPATPAAGTVRLYLRSNGQAPGQSPPQHRGELVMLMPDGNALVLAHTEPS